MKNMKKFEDFINESTDLQTTRSVSTSGLMKISLSLSDEKNFMGCLQELIEQFDLQIINLWPIGPSGGNPEITFRGSGESIIDLLKWYCELTGGEDPYDLYDEYAERDAPIPFEVQSDKRFVTYKRRKFVNVDGTPIL